MVVPLFDCVSTEDQKEDAQLDALEKFSCERIFIEKCSNKSKHRPELDRMLDTPREGDVVIVQNLDRLGRSLKDLLELLDNFKKKGVQFISLNEKIDTTTAIGELAFHMIGAIAKFERTKAGLEAARARGRKGGRKPKLNSADIKKAKAMLMDPDMTNTEVAEHFQEVGQH